ncbi:hypothetical protein K4F52_008439 [Lecanicillium sp. MT-2017a]|nr:hypothetical protein K4F52_008439 [Lecanicillium sp. MT-2017a]
MPGSSPTSTPKRKRGDDTPLTPIKFSFGLDGDDAPEDGSSSPRSSVAHRFRGLGLESSGGGVHADARASPDGISKRLKQDDDIFGSKETAETSTQPKVSQAVVFQTPTAESQPVPEDPASPSKGKGKKRAGTPPLRVKRSPVVQEHDYESEDDVDEYEAEIVDPVRAALTWHEDEITIYDPDDEDDDGTGINGVGFKPTPAIAHARTIKRRQQMAEYRKREESDARSKRSQRRRGDGEASARIDKASARRVRFSDAERRNIAVTTR